MTRTAQLAEESWLLFFFFFPLDKFFPRQEEVPLQESTSTPVAFECCPHPGESILQVAIGRSIPFAASSVVQTCKPPVSTGNYQAWSAHRHHHHRLEAKWTIGSHAYTPLITSTPVVEVRSPSHRKGWEHIGTIQHSKAYRPT